MLRVLWVVFCVSWFSYYAFGSPLALSLRAEQALSTAPRWQSLGNEMMATLFLKDRELVVAMLNSNDYVDRLTPQVFEYAMNYSDRGLIKLMLDRKADSNMTSIGWSSTAVGEAFRKDDFELMRYMLDGDGVVTPDMLVKAAEKKGIDNIAVVKEFLDRGVDVNHTNRDGETPLTAIIDRSRTVRIPHVYEIVNLLIDNGASVSNRKKGESWLDRRAFTPLLAAVAADNIEIVQLLLDRGAGINDISGREHTALSLSKSAEMTELILIKTAQPKTPVELGAALRQAVHKRNKRMVKMILAHDGVDVDATKEARPAVSVEDGVTVITTFSAYGFTSVPDTPTALWIAVNIAVSYPSSPSYSDMVAIIGMLLEAGAGPNISNKGKTALDLVKNMIASAKSDSEHEDKINSVANILLAYGAR